jgi:hypothetical protein
MIIFTTEGLRGPQTLGLKNATPRGFGLPRGDLKKIRWQNAVAAPPAVFAKAKIAGLQRLNVTFPEGPPGAGRTPKA